MTKDERRRVEDGIRRALSVRNYVRAVWSDCRAATRALAHSRAALVALIVLLLPWWALIFLRNDLNWLSGFGGALGIAFSYWYLSRSGGEPASEVKYPRAESLFAFALVGIWIVWRIAICGKLLPFLPSDFVCFKNWAFEILPKVFEQVIVPVVVLFALGYRWRALGLTWSWRAWWMSLPAILVLLAFGVFTYWNALPRFGWQTLEYFLGAGLPEEMLFRMLLFTRLEAWWRNSAWALLGSSIIFGLTHLPINFFVFAARNWNEVWLTALTFQMGMGAALALAYQRARNVWPLTLVHALVNALNF
jgi:membrane protease YdiL (CAAX protease family)